MAADKINNRHTTLYEKYITLDFTHRSYFGRAQYNFDNKYLFEANVRIDGSSRFASGSRWGTFPAFSAGWRITEEEFMKNAGTDWLSNLKLRAGWGQTGNSNIGNFEWQGKIAPAAPTPRRGQGPIPPPPGPPQAEG